MSYPGAGDVDRRVAHAFHHRSGMRTLGDEERSVGVARVVEPSGCSVDDLGRDLRGGGGCFLTRPIEMVTDLTGEGALVCGFVSQNRGNDNNLDHSTPATSGRQPS